MNTLKIALTLLIGILLLWWLGVGVRTGPLYDSVHAMGYRVGVVLPQGQDAGSQLLRDQLTRLEPPPAQPERLPASLREAKAQSTTDTGWLPKPLTAPLILLVCMLGALVLSYRVHCISTVSDGKQGGPAGDRLVRAAVVVVAAGVLIGAMFTFSRVFWTGVDDAFIARSTLNHADSMSIHVLSNTTLSMDRTSLVMLYLAVILTALPTMVLFATRAMGEWSRVEWRISSSRIASTAGGLLTHPLVRTRMCPRSALGVAVLCYMLVTLVLWTAPWSTTMARAIWTP